MIIKYYNGIDEIVDNYPKRTPRPFKSNEKYYIRTIDGKDDAPVNNDSYNESK